METKYEILSREMSELAENMPPGEQHGTETWEQWKKTAQNLGNNISAYCDEILKEGEEWKGIRLNKKYVETLLESYRRIEATGYKKSVEGFDEKKNQLINMLKELEEAEEETSGSFIDRGEWDENVYKLMGFLIEKQYEKIEKALFDQWDEVEEKYTNPKDPRYSTIPSGIMAKAYWDIKVNGIPLCLEFRYWGEDWKEDIIHPDTKTAKEYMRLDIHKGDPLVDIYVYEGTTEKHGIWRAYYDGIDSLINHFWRYNLLNEDGEPANEENDEETKKQVEHIKTWVYDGLPFELPDGTGALYNPFYPEIKDTATGRIIISKNDIGANEVCVYSPEVLKKYMVEFREALDVDRKCEKIWKRMMYYGVKTSLTKGKLEKEDEAACVKLGKLYVLLSHKLTPPEVNPIAIYHGPESFYLFHRLGHFTSWPSPDRVVPPWLTDEEYDKARAADIAGKPIRLDVMDRIIKWNKEDQKKIQDFVMREAGKKVPKYPHTEEMTDAQKQAIKKILDMKQKTWEENGGPQMVEEEYNKRKQEIEDYEKKMREFEKSLSWKEKREMEKEVEKMLGGGA